MLGDSRLVKTLGDFSSPAAGSHFQFDSSMPFSQVCSIFSNGAVIRVGVNDVFGSSGPAEKMLEFYGLTAENIRQKVKEVLAKKK